MSAAFLGADPMRARPASAPTNRTIDGLTQTQAGLTDAEWAMLMQWRHDKSAWVAEQRRGA